MQYRSPAHVGTADPTSPKTDTLLPDDLDQEREMLDVPGIGIVNVKWLKMTSENNL